MPSPAQPRPSFQSSLSHCQGPDILPVKFLPEEREEGVTGMPACLIIDSNEQESCPVGGKGGRRRPSSHCRECFSSRLLNTQAGRAPPSITQEVTAARPPERDRELRGGAGQPSLTCRIGPVSQSACQSLGSACRFPQLSCCTFSSACPAVRRRLAAMKFSPDCPPVCRRCRRRRFTMPRLRPPPPPAAILKRYFRHQSVACRLVRLADGSPFSF